MIAIYCPECGRWLAEFGAEGRAICRDCGCEVTYRSKGARDAEQRPATPAPPTWTREAPRARRGIRPLSVAGASA